MTSSALTNNGALRLGVVLLGGVIIYWLWSSSTSKGLPKNTKDTQKAQASDKEEKKSDATNELASRSGMSVKETRTTTTTTTVRKTATESESDNETVEVTLTRNIK
ncbi:hypothetical protein BGZ70_005839, partial [Mortierella alpina]